MKITKESACASSMYPQKWQTCSDNMAMLKNQLWRKDFSANKKIPIPDYSLFDCKTKVESVYKHDICANNLIHTFWKTRFWRFKASELVVMGCMEIALPGRISTTTFAVPTG